MKGFSCSFNAFQAALLVGHHKPAQCEMIQTCRNLCNRPLPLLSVLSNRLRLPLGFPIHPPHRERHMVIVSPTSLHKRSSGCRRTTGDYHGMMLSKTYKGFKAYKGFQTYKVTAYKGFFRFTTDKQQITTPTLPSRLQAVVQADTQRRNNDSPSSWNIGNIEIWCTAYGTWIEEYWGSLHYPTNCATHYYDASTARGLHAKISLQCKPRGCFDWHPCNK